MGSDEHDVEVDDTDVTISTRARTFVVTATGTSIAAFNVGFDLGAFGNIDHRKIWAWWIVCTVALLSGYLFRNTEYRLRWWLQVGLAMPTAWIIADTFVDDWNNSAWLILAGLSVASLPVVILVIARLMAGEYFALTPRLRAALMTTAVAMLTVGIAIGAEHPRYMTCDDFRLAGEYEPDNCTEP